MKTKLTFLFLFSLILSITQAQDIRPNTQADIDSLRHALTLANDSTIMAIYNKLTNIYFMESKDSLKRDTLLALYEKWDAEATRIGRNNSRGLLRANILIMFMNNKMHGETIRRAPGYLRLMEELGEWDYYYNMYARLVNAYLYDGQKEKALEEASKMKEKATKQQNNTGIAESLYLTSEALLRQNRNKESIEYLRQYIDFAKEKKLIAHYVIKGMSRLSKAYLYLMQNEEALKVADEWEKEIIKYENEGNRRLISDWANLWMTYIDAYINMGEYNLAETYCDKLDNLMDSPQLKLTTYTARAEILNSRGQYTEALEMIEKALEISGDIYSSEANGVRGIKIMILCNMGRGKEAHNLMKKGVAVNDSIRSLSIARQIDEIRTQYEVERHIIEKERNRNYALLATAGLAVTALALGIWIIYSRRLREKNRNLVHRLREQDELDQRLEEQRSLIANLRREIGDEPAKETEETADPLYEQLLELMNQEIYTDLDLNRASLAARMNTNERYLSDLIKHYFNQTVGDFITSYRLRHARRLLTDPQVNYTVEAVAQDSGLGNRVTLHQLFRKHYGLSPSEFRRLSLEKKEEKKV